MLRSTPARSIGRTKGIFAPLPRPHAGGPPRWRRLQHPAVACRRGAQSALGAVWTGSAGVVRVQFQRFPRARVAGGPVCAMSRSRLLMRLSGPTPRRVMLPLCLSALRHSRRQRPRGQAGTRIARPAASAPPPVPAAEVSPGQTGPQDPLLSHHFNSTTRSMVGMSGRKVARQASRPRTLRMPIQLPTKFRASMISSGVAPALWAACMWIWI